MAKGLEDAYTIAEFCAVPDGMSRTRLYQLWEKGRGPRRFRHWNPERGRWQVLLPKAWADEWLRDRRRQWGRDGTPLSVKTGHIPQHLA